MKPAKTLPELERIRAEDAKLKAEERKNFVPEKIQYEDKAAFIVSRCTAGPQGWVGFFRVEQLLVVDAKGKALRTPIRKVVADGVDMVVAMSSMETALRKRVFR